jgi:putative inorganic carbon (hco3(-)) transporter
MNKLISINNFFCLVIFSMPLYMYRLSIFGLPSNVFEILAILAIIFSIVKKRKGLISSLQDFPKMFSVSVLLILTGVLASIFSGGNYAIGFAILKSWFLIPIVFASLLYLNLDSEKMIEKVFMSIYLSASLVGFISVVYKIFGIVTYDNRLQAFYLSPNYLAMYLSSGIFFGFYFLIKFFQNRRGAYHFFLHVLLLALIFIPLYFTYSYGAWIAVCLSFLAITLFTVNKKNSLAISALIVIAATVFIFQTNTQKISALTQSSERSSLASRMMIWNASLMMIEQHPFWGVGPGNFQATYLSLQKYFPPYLEWAVPQPHNLFLAFWIQAGLLGFFGFLLLLSFILRMLWQSLKNKKDTAFIMPLLGYFIYFVLHGLVDTPYWKNDLAFLFWINVFLLIYLHAKAPSKKAVA